MPDAAPAAPTAIKSDSAGHQTTDRHVAEPIVRVVQTRPSGEVIAKEGATAQNKVKSGDQHTQPQLAVVTGETLDVQVVPSVDVITRFNTPSWLTAQNKPNPGDQHTEFHVFAAAAVRAVQVMPSGEVCTL